MSTALPHSEMSGIVSRFICLLAIELDVYDASDTNRDCRLLAILGCLLDSCHDIRQVP
jgi:hypothetical protein